MPTIRIVCPGCGHFRDLDAAVLPQRRARVRCPQCGTAFVHTPASPKPASAPMSRLRGDLGVQANRILFVAFLALVLLAVGVRLWADSRFRNTPYPNLLAASAQGLAVAGGAEVYLLDNDGALLKTIPVADNLVPTQLFWDCDTLWLGDFNSKQLVPLLPAGAPRKLDGVTLDAQFKVARDPLSGKLAVSDGGNHRLLFFSPADRFEKSVAGRGALRFPNDLSFNAAGELLVANTKQPAIDVYSADGVKLRTLLMPQGDRVYRYPTDFVVAGDQLFVLECDTTLERGKVRIYDLSGTRRGELDLGNIEVVGDLATDGERLFVSDCRNRQLLAYRVSDLQPLGAVSSTFAARCADWQRQSAVFEKLSQASLWALLLLCAPVGWFALQLKRQELQAVEQAVLPEPTPRGHAEPGAMTADAVLLTVPVDQSQARVGWILFGVGFVIPMLVALLPNAAGTGAAILLAVALALPVGLLLLYRSGGLFQWQNRQTAYYLKRLQRDGQLALLQDERLERVVLLQRTSAYVTLGLLVFTDRRLLLYHLNWGRLAKIEQIPYEAIKQLRSPVKGELNLIAVLQVMLADSAGPRLVQFFHQRADFLHQVAAEFAQRSKRTSQLPGAELCCDCLQPLQAGHCTSCDTDLLPDRRALWLSLLFPGLGQFYNRELGKGVLFACAGGLLLIEVVVGMRGKFGGGMEVDGLSLYYHTILGILLYSASLYDAYQASIRGRKVR